jgi:hypothetical protein
MLPQGPEGGPQRVRQTQLEHLGVLAKTHLCVWGGGGWAGLPNTPFLAKCNTQYSVKYAYQAYQAYFGVQILGQLRAALLMAGSTQVVVCRHAYIHTDMPLRFYITVIIHFAPLHAPTAVSVVTLDHGGKHVCW